MCITSLPLHILHYMGYSNGGATTKLAVLYQILAAPYTAFRPFECHVSANDHAF